ncbi:unnamed protein product, partial [Rotaria magnacalcarata]
MSGLHHSKWLSFNSSGFMKLMITDLARTHLIHLEDEASNFEFYMSRPQNVF